MATPITTTYVTTDAVGTKESLADLIAQVDPADCPLYSMSEKTRCKARVHEWQEYRLPDPVTVANLPYRLEGEQADRPTVGPSSRRRLQNPASVFFIDYAISGTLQSVDVAGADSEAAWRRTVAALEVRRLAETAFVANNVAVTPADNATAREIGGLPTWCGADRDGLDVVTPIAATPALIEGACQDLWARGVTPNTVLISPEGKKAVSDVAETGTIKTNNEAHRTNTQALTDLGAVSIYMSDLGDLQMVVDRYLSTTVHTPAVGPTFVFDKNMIRVAEARAFEDVTLGKSGDNIQKMCVWEGSLEICAPFAVECLQ